jgi:hypothetical protein
MDAGRIDREMDPPFTGRRTTRGGRHEQRLAGQPAAPLRAMRETHRLPKGYRRVLLGKMPGDL